MVHRFLERPRNRAYNSFKSNGIVKTLEMKKFTISPPLLDKLLRFLIPQHSDPSPKVDVYATLLIAIWCLVPESLDIIKNGNQQHLIYDILWRNWHRNKIEYIDLIEILSILYSVKLEKEKDLEDFLSKSEKLADLELTKQIQYYSILFYMMIISMNFDEDSFPFLIFKEWKIFCNKYNIINKINEKAIGLNFLTEKNIFRRIDLMRESIISVYFRLWLYLLETKREDLIFNNLMDHIRSKCSYARMSRIKTVKRVLFPKLLVPDFFENCMKVKYELIRFKRELEIYKEEYRKQFKYGRLFSSKGLRKIHISNSQYPWLEKLIKVIEDVENKKNIYFWKRRNYFNKVNPRIRDIINKIYGSNPFSGVSNIQIANLTDLRISNIFHMIG